MIFNNYEQSVFDEIDTYKDMIDKQKKEIREKELIIESLESSLVKSIRNIDIPYSDKMMRAAWSQQHKPADEKQMYNFMKDDLRDRCFTNKTEANLINILPLNHDHCKYGFIFEYKGFKFEISIPNVKCATTENMDNMHYGQYVLYCEVRNHVWDLITTCTDIDDFKDVIDNFIKEKGEDK